MVESMIQREKGILGLDEDVTTSEASPPSDIDFTDMLITDIQALQKFFKPEIHLLIPTRLIKSMGVVYGFGDASGAGFGATLLYPGLVKFKHGLLSTKIS